MAFTDASNLTGFRAFIMSVGAINMAVAPPRPRNTRLCRSAAEMIRTAFHTAYKQFRQEYITLHPVPSTS